MVAYAARCAGNFVHGVGEEHVKHGGSRARVSADSRVRAASDGPAAAAGNATANSLGFEPRNSGNHIPYETVWIDQEPERKEAMIANSGVRVVPQLHYGASWWKIDDFRELNESERVQEVLGAAAQ